MEKRIKVSDSPKILFVAHSMKMGGAEKVLLQVVKHFHGLGFQIFLAGPNGPMLDQFLPYCKKYFKLFPGFLPLTFSFLRYLKALAAMVLNTIALFFFIRFQSSIDLIFSNTSVTLHGSVVARIFKIPSVVMVHENMNPNIVSSFLRSGLLWLNTRVIVVSKAMTKLFQNKRGTGKVVRIPEGVSLGKGSPGKFPLNHQKTSLFFGDEKGPLVGIVGKVLPIKGQEYFLQMAAKVSLKHYNAKFVVMGEYQPKSLYFQKLLRLRHSLNLKKQVFFTGFVDNLNEAISKLDVLVVSSESEEMPLVILEAMALEKPVVSFNVGGISDVLENGRNGYLVDFGDIQGLAEAVGFLLGDRQTASRMGIEGRLLVEKEFSAAQQCKQIEQTVCGLFSLSSGPLVS